MHSESFTLLTALKRLNLSNKSKNLSNRFAAILPGITVKPRRSGLSERRRSALFSAEIWVSLKEAADKTQLRHSSAGNDALRPEKDIASVGSEA